jgi:hypothetical protein
VSVVTRVTSAIRRLGIVVAIATAFLFGLATTVYLSLRSPEVKVPDVVGKDRFDAEKILAAARLNFRVRATRPSNQLKADTVLFQLPHGGEVVKAGQTVSMDISRTAKEGEAPESAAAEKKPVEEEKTENRNADESVANTNENKPKRAKISNKNANENSNANAGNRNGNINRANTNTDSANRNRNANRTTNTAAGANLNRVDSANSNRNRNQNDNRRAPAATPSPPGLM